MRSAVSQSQGRNAPCPCGSQLKYKKCCLQKDEVQRKPHTGEDAVILLMPTRGQICYETQTAIEQNMGGVKFAKIMAARKPVIEARNQLAKKALEVARQNPFPFSPREWFALWVDDDAYFMPGSVSMMLQCMQELRSIDALFGKFGARVPYSKVHAWRKADDSESYPKEGIDCGGGEVVDIERAGFHFVSMRMSLLERVGPNPFDIPTGSQIGEDFAFCDRAIAVGARLAVGMGMPIFHLDPADGSAFVPGMAQMLVDGNQVHPLGQTSDVRKYGSGIDEMSEALKAAAPDLKAEMLQRRNISDGIAQIGAA